MDGGEGALAPRRLCASETGGGCSTAVWGLRGRWEMRLPGEEDEDMVRSGLPKFTEPENPAEILFEGQEKEAAGSRL